MTHQQSPSFLGIHQQSGMIILSPIDTSSKEYGRSIGGIRYHLADHDCLVYHDKQLKQLSRKHLTHGMAVVALPDIDQYISGDNETIIAGLTLYRYFDEEKGLMPYCSLMKKKNLTFLERMLADDNMFGDRLRLDKEGRYPLLSDIQSLGAFDAKNYLQQLAQTGSEDQIVSFLGGLMIGYGDMIIKQTGDTSTLIGAKIFVPLTWNLQGTHEYRKKMLDYLALRGFQIGYTIIQQKYDMLQIHCTDPLITQFWKTLGGYQYDHNIFVERQKNVAALFQGYCTQHTIVMKNDWSDRIRMLDVDRI